MKALRIKNDTEAVELLEEVVERSQGVFLSVYLVVRSLVDGLRNHDKISHLHERLRSVLSDLDVFFRHIFKTLDPIYHKETARMFQVALAAYSPLSPIAYWYMEEADQEPDLAVSMPIQELTPEELEAIMTQTNARIYGRCKGLLEITPPVRTYDRVYYVDFLHRTVRDFFMANDINDIFITEQQTEFDAHMTICRGILAQLKSITTVPIVGPPPVSDLLRCFFHAATRLERENKVLPAECLDEVYSTIDHNSSSRDDMWHLWEQFGDESFMGVIVAQDLQSYMAVKMVIFTKYGKEEFLQDVVLKIEPLSQGMIVAILSNGPATSFGQVLQVALAMRLETSNNKFARVMVDAILDYSSFSDPAHSETCPPASESLWEV